jgi:nitrous oxidase accessory protein NosD
VYIENNNITSADDNNIDFVAVQYGHIQSNIIHNAGDWCMYTKGGSADIRIEGNEIYNCDVGGYVAGQGTGLEYMVTPWIHYEAYDIKFINNVIHDTQGAGNGCQWGYNILLAYNTLYHVGTISHAIEVVFGLRSCDGDPLAATSRSANLALGGWGTTVLHTDGEPDSRPQRLYFQQHSSTTHRVYRADGNISRFIWQAYRVPERIFLAPA